MYYTVIKHDGHLRTLEKCRKHSPAVRVFYISRVFSNARRVLSQCNTRLTLLYLLNRNAIGSIELEVIASEDVQDSKNQVSVFWYFNSFTAKGSPFDE